MRDLDVKPQNYKTPKENTGENDYNFRFGKGFTATNTKNIIHTIKKSVNWALPKSKTHSQSLERTGKYFQVCSHVAQW